MEREIKLVGFACKFCALLSFELGPRPQEDVKLELVELPCAGRIEARSLLRAFEKGADAVFVAGCPAHECLNLKGSARAEKRIGRVKAMLDEIGLGGDRLMLYRVSGTHGPRLAQIVAEAAAKVKDIGLSPLQGGNRPGGGLKP
jgi:F420-non-reducing hydrogenase iron-sulfur subunit